MTIFETLVLLFLGLISVLQIGSFSILVFLFWGEFFK